MCVCIKAFDMLLHNYKTHHINSLWDSLDHEELLINLVLELQMKCFTKSSSKQVPIFSPFLMMTLCVHKCSPCRKYVIFSSLCRNWVITNMKRLCSPPATNILVNIYISTFIWYLQDRR